jgi:hypothetical protein
VRARRALVRRELPKVKPGARGELEEALVARGLEVTPRGVRLPAREQTLALFRDAPLVEEKGLAARLALVVPAEAKQVVAALLREKAIERVERPSGPALALPSVPLLDAGEAVRLVKELEGAIRWLRRAAKGPANKRPRLLRRDLSDLTARLGAAPDASDARKDPEAAPPASLLPLLARTASELAARHGGLAPIPSLVRAIGAPTAQIHAALLEGHARGWFELQPESSMGRWSADDLALCVPGPEGTRLSWLRPLRTGAAAGDAAPGTVR